MAPRRAELPQAAAVALLIGIGWLATTGRAVRDRRQRGRAQAARLRRGRAAVARDGTAAGPHGLAGRDPVYNPAEILAETGIVLPTLPAGWRVVDVQVFPSQEATASRSRSMPELGRVSLFAARAAALRRMRPTTAARSPKSLTVTWRSGPLAYALTGSGCESRPAARRPQRFPPVSD